MDPLWVAAAFVFGAIAGRVGLPPLVGFLVAGFVLKGFGIDGGDFLARVSDIGVTLLLFTIGLKLKFKSLAKTEVWAGGPLHMLITIAFFGCGILILGIWQVPYFDHLQWQSCLLVAFTLSFSSTVFAVKMLEQKKETASKHGVVAIGILIMQDVIAVIFLAFSSGKIPSLWAAALIPALFILKPLAGKFVRRCGHGEMLILFGILMTLAGYRSFELVGLKGDLGALIFGMLLASNPAAHELSERLLGFKDLLLVGFFLNIGMSGLPTPAGFAVALGLAVAMLLKPVAYFFLLTRFRLRARTSMLASFSLANYSEFGLIVGAISVSKGWLGTEWLIIIAIALSFTFIIAAPLNSAAHRMYTRLAPTLKHFETAKRLLEDRPIDSGNAQIVIIGMGRIGASAYDAIQERYGDVVLGIDFSLDNVKAHQALGRNVVYGDAEDSDFWERVEPSRSRVHTVMLALPNVEASAFAVRQMHQRGYKGRIAASVRYEDEIPVLQKEGVHATYSLYEEAGAGFAEHVHSNQDVDML
jgi:glutathione-regulated potassium-efflux system ancillary protein KefC